MTELIKQAYHPDAFRKQGYQLIDLLADYLENAHFDEPDTKVLNWKNPQDLYEEWEADAQILPKPDVHSFFKKVLHETIHMHFPKYIGHQTSNVVPVAALAELLGSFLDPGMGIYEQGTSGVILERLLIKNLATDFDMDADTADGFFTSGGTLGNLTALLCARQVMIPEDVWENGLGRQQYGFLVSEEAHFSVARAVQVMGMGKKGAVAVPVNEKFQMRVDCLEDCLKKAKMAGLKIIGVVANACSTAVGAYDDISAIADFCESHQLWLHVDAAHGGCVVFSEAYRSLLKGIERADSVILDFHKMLMTPTLVTAIVFKNGQHSYQTFAQKASYLWHQDDSQEWYNLAKRTFELTKPSLSIRLYALLRTFGKQLFAENVEVLYGLANQFAKMLQGEECFEMPLAMPQANIVCFRYVENGWQEEKIEQVNLKIRELIVKEGMFFLVQTRVQGTLYLRTALMNPFTTEQILEELLEKIKGLNFA